MHCKRFLQSWMVAPEKITSVMHILLMIVCYLTCIRVCSRGRVGRSISMLGLQWNEINCTMHMFSLPPEMVRWNGCSVTPADVAVGFPILWWCCLYRLVRGVFDFVPETQWFVAPFCISVPVFAPLRLQSSVCTYVCTLSAAICNVWEGKYYLHICDCRAMFAPIFAHDWPLFAMSRRTNSSFMSSCWLILLKNGNMIFWEYPGQRPFWEDP